MIRIYLRITLPLSGWVEASRLEDLGRNQLVLTATEHGSMNMPHGHELGAVEDSVPVGRHENSLTSSFLVKRYC